MKEYKIGIKNPNATVDWVKYSGLVDRSSFQTKDGMTINGLVLKSKSPRGYILVAQGTSMLAAEIYEEFSELHALGLDVYIYDYRGFGESIMLESTFKGMVSDFRSRIKELNRSTEYKHHFLYGLSMGGVIFSNVLAELSDEIDGVVFDSVPREIPWYAFCPKRFSPKQLLPENCSDWFFISGKLDEVVGRRAEKLGKLAEKKCGANSIVEDEFGHIFTDGELNTRRRISAASDHYYGIIQR